METVSSNEVWNRNEGLGLLSSSNPILIRYGMGVWKAIRANWDSLNRFIRLDIR